VRLESGVTLMPKPASPAEPLWYKDAVIYELHVKAFADSNGDGIGDFAGLTGKLDYLQALGVTCLWLLPFNPSPMRDDGYDIRHHRAVDERYGGLPDFRRFLREAHARGLRVITELVVNHTSDQHPWFQAARRAAPGSPTRDFYVWSDTTEKYQDARVIFTDTETSNWTWDPVAGAYYWHRFFHHQPDLNFDNPAVRRAMLRVMRFWLDMGVDGLRLDAVPYLVEREGTACENLAETHDLLRVFRADMDRRFQDRMLLAEANQWPADVRPYFGDGDECHMAFHFPLMTRMFVALLQEDRHPITEILKQTPDIPDTCQWALFLRNHDELTLEMVTHSERDYMYRAYGADPQMRLNLGIRRRLAPLVENSRRRIELLNSLLLSLPGTPIIYYGDEIAMGDNIYLGDRNGVRTPMQWTSDRNAGFSRADPARLYAPPIMDPVYGYQSVNVEAQERSPSSLLQWMKRMIALRRQHRLFGRGGIRFLPLDNRKVLAYARTFEGDTVVVVANLARTVQPACVDLTAFKGLVPIEMIGRAEFPRIGEAPYFLTLAPFGFYWFELVQDAAPISVRPPAVPERWDAPGPLVAGGAWDRLFDGHVRVLIERDHLPAFLQRQPWSRGRTRPIRTARFVDWGIVRRGAEPAFLTFVEAAFDDGAVERYLLPLVLAAGQAADAVETAAPDSVLARLTGAREGLIYDAGRAEVLADALLATVESGQPLLLRYGSVRGRTADAYRAWRDLTPERRAVPRVTTGAGEQGHSSIGVGNQLILKLFRRTEAGPNPDVEIGEQLAGRLGLPIVPPFFGALHYERPGEPQADVAILQRLVPNQGTGWDHALHEISRFLERVTGLEQVLPRPSDGAAPPPAVQDAIGAYLAAARALGRRTGELHLALAAEREQPAFAPEPFTPTDVRELITVMTANAHAVLDRLSQALDRLPAGVDAAARIVLDRRAAIDARFSSLDTAWDLVRIRVHGDYHLGKVLRSQDDFVILDFEGEPGRTLAERRTRQLALKDVASMVRSLSYAAMAGVATFTASRPIDAERDLPWAGVWQAWTTSAFLDGYRETTAGAAFVPADPGAFDRMVAVLTLGKAVDELGYELDQRLEWVHIPLRGLLELTREERGE
jgi:maltose alpha-D-glucosyltransferase/alpha-amylase